MESGPEQVLAGSEQVRIGGLQTRYRVAYGLGVLHVLIGTKRSETVCNGFERIEHMISNV